MPLLCALMFFLLSSGAIAAREVYLSNAIGAFIRELPSDTSVRYSEYILTVDENDTTRTERLYRNGALVRRTLYVTVNRQQSELIYKEGTLSEENIYDADGRLLSAKEYDGNSELLSSVSYKHSSDSVTARHSDALGAEIFTEERFFDQNGRVIRIARAYSDERIEEVRFIFLERQLLREVHTLGDLVVNIHYDANGRIIKETHHIADELREEIVYSYDARAADRIANTIMHLEIIDEVAHLQEREYNAAGEEIERAVYEDDILLEEAFFEYEDGNLLQARINRTGSTSQQQLIYNSDGEVIEEQWYDNDLLVRSVFPEEEGTRQEIRYINGQPYVRVYFENGVRIREEFVAEDAVIRERVLE